VKCDLRERRIQAILLDIEGTTTPVTFVTEVLFPFARKALPSFVREHLESVHLREPFRRLHEEWMVDRARGESPPDWWDDPDDARAASIIAYAEWLMDRDRKAFGLKALQGLMWARGYEDRALRGEVYPDVPLALKRWRAAGIPVAIFSSGSVLGQQLLFSTTAYGDLTPSLTAYFDTGVGAKTSAESYRRIASALDCPIDRMLFVSDATTEIDAARDAGCVALLCQRPGDDFNEIA
jgi:enolase-phosphatase E1